MTAQFDSNYSNSSQSKSRTRSKKLKNILGLAVSIEAVLVLSGAVYFLVQIFAEAPGSFIGALVIFAITIVIGIGLLVTAVAIFLQKSWTRGAILTWQILQIVLATSFLQGIPDWRPLGWILLGLSIVGLLLLTLTLLNGEPSQELE